MQKRALTALVTVLALVLLYLPEPGAAAGKPCRAYALLEARTGQLLLEENSSESLPMGTMAKLMTMLLTAEALESGALSENTAVTASPAANAQKGASIWLMPGEKMTVGDLLRGMIIGNANDAAVALAEAVSGTEDQFVMDMNARGFELGLRSTVFTCASGLSEEGQVTTAADLGRLCCKLTEYPVLTPYMTTWRTFLRGEQTELVNENTLVRSYDGLLGMKAGHGERTGYTLAAAAQRGDGIYVAVVLGCQEDADRFSIAKTLLSKGFGSYQVTTPAFSGEFLKPLQVLHGTDTAVEVEAQGLTGITVPKGNAGLQTVLVLPEYVEAPVSKGQQLGTAAFYQGDIYLYEVPLTAASSVPRLTFSRAFLRLLDNMLK